MAIYYLFKFEEDVEYTLANILFTELEEAKKTINNSPGFGAIGLDKLPDTLTAKFPKEGWSDMEKSKKFLLLSVTLFSSHINKKEKTCEYLASLRQYIHYHVHSFKTYLHSRIRSKVNIAHIQINMVKFESDDVRTYRGRKGEGEQVDFRPREKNPTDIILRAK